MLNSADKGRFLFPLSIGAGIFATPLLIGVPITVLAQIPQAISDFSDSTSKYIVEEIAKNSTVLPVPDLAELELLIESGIWGLTWLTIASSTLASIWRLFLLDRGT